MRARSIRSQGTSTTPEGAESEDSGGRAVHQGQGLLHRAHAGAHHRSALQTDGRRDLRARAHRVRVQGRGLRARPQGVRRNVTLRTDRRHLRPGPRLPSLRPSARCALLPGTSTSTTSPPAPWWASSPSAAPVRPAPTTRPAAIQNMLRWTSPRSIKETFVPPDDYRYPFMG